MAAAEIGVIGGSGLYDFLEGTEEIELTTPYGPPSAPLVLGTVGDRRVAFLPRHGREHQLPPHAIPYRANLWALRAAGVTQVLAPCAVGGLQPTQSPGDLVIPDQLVDRTIGREQTFHDTFRDGPVHVSFADPYCPSGRAVSVERAGARGWQVTDGGTMVVVEGPRFSTRAESQWYSGLGWSVINMTGHPEAVLARELGLCYSALALITDLDAGVESGQEVTQDEVFRVFGEKTTALRELLLEVVTGLPTARTCGCDHDLAKP